MLNAIHKGSDLQIAGFAQDFVQKGVVQYEKLLAISLHGRIPNLTHVYGLETIHKMVAVLLTRFNNELNLVRPMSAEQIEGCSFELVMTSEEDQLSIEDLVVFFRGAMQGKYGRIYDRLDMQTVFSLLEEYREERWQALQKFRLEEAAQIESLGPSERSVQKDELADSFHNILGRMHDMREKLREQRSINRGNYFSKQIDG